MPKLPTGIHLFIPAWCFQISLTGLHTDVELLQKKIDTGIELLQRKIAPGAFRDSAERYGPPKCHEHTRVAISQEIMDWIRNVNRQTGFSWLYGPAGAGKSAIERR